MKRILALVFLLTAPAAISGLAAPDSNTVLCRKQCDNMLPGANDTTDLKRFVSLLPRRHCLVLAQVSDRGVQGWQIMADSLRTMLHQLAGHAPNVRLGPDPQRYLDSVINQRVSWWDRIGYADKTTSRAQALEALVLEMVSGLLQNDLEFNIQAWRAQWRYSFLK